MLKKMPELLLVFCILLLSGCTQQQTCYTSITCHDLKPKPIKDVRVALVLGTGGFRSMAHLGVIEVLEKEKIPIDLIVGSSAGSLIGAAYCDRPKVALIKDTILHIRKKSLLGASICSSPCVVLEKFINNNLSVRNFEDLKIPLVVVATNINNNKTALIRSGPIAPAILASSADPLIFKPVTICGHSVVDGGVLNPVPVDIARFFNPKLVIAVNVSSPPTTKPIKNKRELLARCIDICFYKFSGCEADKADISLQPCLDDFDVYNDQRNFEAYEAGKKAAYAAISRIKKALAQKGVKS